MGSVGSGNNSNPGRDNSPKLTAYALGELSADEQRALEAELSAAPELQREVEAIAEVADWLRAELGRDAPSRLSSEQRSLLEGVTSGACEVPASFAEGDISSDAVAPSDPEGEALLGSADGQVSGAESAASGNVVRIGRGRTFAVAGLVMLPAAAALVLGIQRFNNVKNTFESDQECESCSSSSPSRSADSLYRASPGDSLRQGSGLTPAAPAAGYGVGASPGAADSFDPIANSVPPRSRSANSVWPGDVMESFQEGGETSVVRQLSPSRAISGGSAIPENPFIFASVDPKSTFSVDVDTASYSMIRRILMGNGLPDAGLVRTEEMINAFPYAYPQPVGSAFSVTTDIAAAPWAASHQLLRIGIQGKNIPVASRPPANLVFLIDVSGSMEGADRLELLKKGLGLLVDQLGERDSVAIVVYAGSSGLVLPPTSGRERATIREALARLTAGGSTNGEAGISLAYQVAQQAFVKGGSNRVILATDGDFNVGVQSHEDLVRLIENKAKTGVFLSVLGFGTGNFRDRTMEQLADKGNGNYAYIDRLEEARRVLVEQASGTLHTIAKDVKIQITFDPALVRSFRLIGYENRVMAHNDFHDDRKDAGDIGAGHQVTALYEIEPARAQPGTSVPAPRGAHLATLALRYKEPDGVTSRLVTRDVTQSETAFSESPTDFRFAAAVAGFAMVLRGSGYRGSLGYSDVARLAEGALGQDPDGRRRELLGLVRAAERIAAGSAPTPLPSSLPSPRPVPPVLEGRD